MDSNYSYYFNLILAGESGVGKTHMLHSYLNFEYKDSFFPTIGLDFRITVLEALSNIRVKTCIWDLAGEDRFRMLISSYFRNTKGVFLVYDITNAESFLNIEKWYNFIKQYQSCESIMMLVGNKLDLVEEYPERRAVAISEGLELARKYKFLFIETSAITKDHLREAFDYMAHLITMKEESTKKDSISLSRPFYKKLKCLK